MKQRTSHQCFPAPLILHFRYAIVSLLILIPLPRAGAQTQFPFKVEPRVGSDTLFVQVGNIPMLVDLKQIRVESMRIMSYLGLDVFPNGYTYATFEREGMVHCVFALPGARALLDVFGHPVRKQPSFAFHVTNRDAGYRIRESAPLAVTKEGFMVTLTDSSIQLRLPDGRSLDDGQDLPLFFFDTNTSPIISLTKEYRNGDTLYHVQVAFLPASDAGGERDRQVLHCRYEVNGGTIHIGPKTADREQSMLSSDELQPSIHVR